MSNDSVAPETPAQRSAPEKSKKPEVEMTILRPYPKVVFFYLTWIASLVAGIVTSMYAVPLDSAADKVQDMVSVQQFWTYLWLVVFTLNLMVVAFEFGRMVIVSVVFFSLALIFLAFWQNWITGVLSFLGDIDPAADHKFFFFVFTVFTVIYIFVFIQTRFNYWVVGRNELRHKHGFLGDVKRYHAQHVKINKEIPDVFEFLLLRSGSMVLHPEGEDRAFVLENIIGINGKEKEVKQILESYAVRIDND